MDSASTSSTCLNCGANNQQPFPSGLSIPLNSYPSPSYLPAPSTPHTTPPPCCLRSLQPNTEETSTTTTATTVTSTSTSTSTSSASPSRLVNSSTTTSADKAAEIPAPVEADTPPGDDEEAQQQRVSWRRKLLLVMVGIKARGKTYISAKLGNFLRWRGYNAATFSAEDNPTHLKVVQTKYSTTDHHTNTCPAFSSNSYHDSLHSLPCSSSSHLPPSSDLHHSHPQIDSCSSTAEDISRELNSALAWLAQGGDVAILDDETHTESRKQRLQIIQLVRSCAQDLRIIFIESICDDPNTLQRNYKVKIQTDPFYKNLPEEKALALLLEDVAGCQSRFETFCELDDDLSYIQVINLASKVICNRIHGQLAHSLAAFLMSIHVRNRPIYLVRAGTCTGSTQPSSPSTVSPAVHVVDRSQIPHVPRVTYSYSHHASHSRPPAPPPCDSPKHHSKSLLNNEPKPFYIPISLPLASRLNEQGREFAEKLSQYLKEKCEEYAASHPNAACSCPYPAHHMFYDPNTPASSLYILSSTLPRAVETTEILQAQTRTCNVEYSSALCALDMGPAPLTTLPSSQLQSVISAWSTRKYTHRWGGGESQCDKAKTLETSILELERCDGPVVIVSHLSTLQILYGYLKQLHPDQNYEFYLPKGSVLELTPHKTSICYTENVIKLMDIEEPINTTHSMNATLAPLSPTSKSLNFAAHIQSSPSFPSTTLVNQHREYNANRFSTLFNGDTVKKVLEAQLDTVNEA